MTAVENRVFGSAVDRVDGPEKVTGRARYSVDRTAPDMLWGHLVTSHVASGRIVSLDADNARRAPGVAAVYSPFAPLPIPPLPSLTNPRGPRWAPLADTVVHHHGQVVALVVAETPEQARGAAHLVVATYDTDDLRAAVDLDDAGREAVPEDVDHGQEAEVGFTPDGRTVPDVLAGSDVVVRGRYRTSAQNHAAMEPHSALAWWSEDGGLHVRTGHQAIPWAVAELAATFGLEPNAVEVVATHIGGGFGGKTRAGVDVKLACAASRVLGRPVKVTMTREQVFTSTIVRGMTEQDVALGADRDGRLTAVEHRSRTAEAAVISDLLAAPGHTTTRMLYASDAQAVGQRKVTLNVPRTGFMRGPSEVPGSFAIETAMDELAVALDLDPVELRRRNDAPTFPGTPVPWSSKHLDECLRVGVERFGWHRRPRRPGSWREGEDDVGLGMAVTTYRATQVAPVTVAVTLYADGRAEVAASAVDLGTGMATVMAVTAADTLRIPIDRVTVRYGDSALPPGGAALGSTGTVAVAPAVHAAVRAAVAELRTLAGLGPEAAVDSFAELLAVAGRPEATGHGSTEPRGPFDGGRAHWSFGAQFCEVRVHRRTREPRVSRMLGVMDVGRVVNAKTARSQISGGMIWGLSAALFEGLEFDDRGRMTNVNLADYLVPVNADVPDVDVVLLDIPDEAHNDLGVRGAGEIGAGGMSAAVGNAIFNATGIRRRELPMTLDGMFADAPGVGR